MDVRAPLAGRLYADAATHAKPQPAQPTQQAPAQFANSLQDGALETLRALRGAEETVKSGLAGRADAQSVVQALAQTELAVETATTVRDKVVEAYNEILRMPV
ncbi:MAG: flagellar hook-basal body complex protein FliE [Rubrimonas sp.]|uniref:flagellar hook-basal body complex protein FliE n=1 Tax=Rubrimonas sp. TaxID=2036015 RepID=UPI002FDE8CA1